MLKDVNTNFGDNYIKIRTQSKKDFHFINVDLELESSESVQSIVAELSETTFSLYCSDIDEMANLELNIDKADDFDFYETYDDEKDLVGGIDAHITEFCNLIENLSLQSKRIWNGCHRKEFDIGFRAGNTAKSFHTKIKAETIKRCVEIGATIGITVYPHLNYEIRHKDNLPK